MSDSDLEAARAAWRAGDHRRALAVLDGLLAAHGGDITLWSTRGLWLEALGRHEDALAAFRRSTAIRPTYPDHYNAGNMLLALGRLAEAIAEYDASIACNAAYPEAWVNRGIAHYRLGAGDRARDDFDRALAIDAAFVPALRCKAILERGLGRRDAAEELLARIAAARPDDPAAAFELARALAELPADRHIDLEPHGRSWRALAAVKRAIELAPADRRAWALEVDLLAMLMHANVAFRRMRSEGGRVAQETFAGPLQTGTFFDEQVARCREATARFERDPLFPTRLADAYEFAGDRARAAEQRRRVCELAPDVAENHVNLAFALDELGDLDAAVDAARRAVELDPSLAAELPERVARRLA